MPIKNIIFDLGGVIINVDYHKTLAAFRELGALNIDEIYGQKEQDAFIDDFEIGKITSQEFREILRLKLGLKITDSELDHAWNQMLLDLPYERLEFIKSLSPKYRVFLFSNNNDIHLNEILNICMKQHGIDNFDTLFEKVYYSNKIGYRKPEPSSFTKILIENDLAPEETLFIDDSIQHVQGAKAAGLESVLLSQQYTIFNTLEFIKAIDMRHKEVSPQ